MTLQPTTVFTRFVARPYDECHAAVCAAIPDATPVRTPEGTRLAVDVPVGRRRSIRMRLEIAPWTTDGTTTGLELVPTRRVRSRPGYFRAGHRFLDDVVASLLSPRARLVEVPVRTERRSVHSAA